MRIVVTGSSGFIGRHLVEACKKHWPEADVIGIDIADGTDCREWFASDQSDCDIAIHCAAITGGIEGTTGNAAMLAALNQQIDGAFFEWALRVRPHRSVYFSSSCAYPMLSQEAMAHSRKLREMDINFALINGHPDNTYGWVKLLGEVVANSVRDAGVPMTIVRPFAVYGADQETCRMIPMFVQRALTPAADFEVWGEGDQCSDFIHVDDVVNAVVSAIDNDIDGPVNLGTGRGASVDEVANIVMNAAGIDRAINHRLDKPSGPLWRVADTAILESFYKPQISLEAGIQRAIWTHAVPTSYGAGDDLA